MYIKTTIAGEQAYWRKKLREVQHSEKGELFE